MGTISAWWTMRSIMAATATESPKTSTQRPKGLWEVTITLTRNEPAWLLHGRRREALVAEACGIRGGEGAIAMRLVQTLVAEKQMSLVQTTGLREVAQPDRITSKRLEPTQRALH